MGDHRRTLVRVARLGLSLGLAASVTATGSGPVAAQDPIAYPLADFASRVLTPADISALYPGVTLIPTASGCVVAQDASYACDTTYPTPPFGYARPWYLSAASYPDRSSAKAAFDIRRQRTLASAGSTTVLADGATGIDVEQRTGGLHFWVRSIRLVGNHLLEAACTSRISPGDTVPNVRTCTHIALNAQQSRLEGLVSPVPTTPSAPVSVVAAVKGANAVVTWLAPESSGTEPISEYRVLSTTGGLGCTVAPTTQVLQTCTVTGLQPGARYAFTVQAVNVVGPSAPSEASTPIASTAKPTQPRSVRATAAGTAATVRWASPRSNGGLPVRRYLVTAAPGGATCQTQERSCVVEGLAPSTRYRFTVRAVNGRGEGPGARSSFVRTPSAPVAPPPTTTPTPANTDKPEAPLS